MSSKRLPLFNIIAVLVLILVSLPLSTPAAQDVAPPEDPDFDIDYEGAYHQQMEESSNEIAEKAGFLENDIQIANYITRYQSYGNAAFQLYQHEEGSHKKYSKQGCFFIEGGIVSLSAPIDIPMDSIITGIDAYIDDTSATSNIGLELVQYHYKGDNREVIARLTYESDWADGEKLEKNYNLNHKVNSSAYNFGFSVTPSESNTKHIICQLTIRYKEPLPSIFPIALPLINN